MNHRMHVHPTIIGGLVSTCRCDLASSVAGLLDLPAHAVRSSVVPG